MLDNRPASTEKDALSGASRCYTMPSVCSSCMTLESVLMVDKTTMTMSIVRIGRLRGAGAKERSTASVG